MVRTAFREVRCDDWVFSVNGERLFLKGEPGADAHGARRGDELELRHDLDARADADLDLLRVHAHVADRSCTTRPTRPACSSGRTSRCSGATRGRAQAGGAPGARDGRPARPPPERVPVVRAQRAVRRRPEPVRRPGTARGWRRPWGLLPTWNTNVLDRSVRGRGSRRRDRGPAGGPAQGRAAPVAAARRHRHPPVPSAGTTATLGGLAPRCGVGPASARFVSEFGAQAVPDGRDGWPPAVARPRLGPPGAAPRAEATSSTPRAAASRQDVRRVARRETQAYQAALLQLHRGPAPAQVRRPAASATSVRRPAPGGDLVGPRPRAAAPSRLRSLRDACRPVLPMVESRAGLVHVVNEPGTTSLGAVIEVGRGRPLALTRRRRPDGRRRVGRRCLDGCRGGVDRLGPRTRVTLAAGSRAGPSGRRARIGRGRASGCVEPCAAAGGRADGLNGSPSAPGVADARTSAAGHELRQARSGAGPAWAGPRSRPVLPVGGRQEVGDGGHRRDRLMGYVFAHMVGNLQGLRGRSPDRQLRRVAARRSPAAPAHVGAVAAAHRTHRRLRAPHPRRLRADPRIELACPPAAYRSRRDYVAAELRQPHDALDRHHHRCSSSSSTCSTSPGARRTRTSCAARSTGTTVATASSGCRWRRLHRRRASRSASTCTTALVEPVPEPRLEQSAASTTGAGRSPSGSPSSSSGNISVPIAVQVGWELSE